MPCYEFECKKCQHRYDEIVAFDKTEKYPTVKCPECGSGRKEKLISPCQFAFANPIDTDAWNSDSTGHDYRFKHGIPKVKQERAIAESLSHMGTNPYGAGAEADLHLDTGIHDPETRPGLT
jgi:putative FmdB family regulatory protein